MKTIYLIISISFFSIIVKAQNQQGPAANKEKIESLRVSFLTNKMNLTPEEAQKFWPVYNQYKNEMKALRKDKKELATDAEMEINSMSDAEISQLIEQKFALEQKELEIKKKYVAEYKKIIPLKKLAAFYRGEEEFKLQLLKQAANKNK